MNLLLREGYGVKYTLLKIPYMPKNGGATFPVFLYGDME
jgi:hypothetical protein